MKKYLLIIGLSLALSGCAGSTDTDTNVSTSAPDNTPSQAVSQAPEQNQRSAELKLRQGTDTDENIVVEITLSNPEQVDIASVRSFLAFDPSVLQGTKIQIPEGTTAAPGEESIDNDNGLIRLGLSSDQFTAAETPIARVIFTRVGDQFTTLDFFGVGAETTILTLNTDGELEDILITPQTPGLILSSTTE